MKLRSQRPGTWSRGGVCLLALLASLVGVPGEGSPDAPGGQPTPGNAVALDDDFDNGNLNGWSFDGTYHAINTNNAPGEWQWVYFRATGVAGRTPRFRTATASSNDVYRSYHRMVYRYRGGPWRFMDQGSKPGDGYYYFGNSTPFVDDEVFVAYWYPYGLEDAYRFYRRVLRSHNPALRARRMAGRSREGRYLLRYSISDRADLTSGLQIVVVGRQHGYESLGNHVIEEMTRFLLSSDPVARDLRQRAVVHFYPMANADAAWHGWTREGLDRNGTTWIDFNRDWQRLSVSMGGIPSATLEIDAYRDDIVAATAGRADVLLDVHSHSKGSTGSGWYWWYLGDAGLALDLITAVWNADLELGGGSTLYTWPTTTPGGNAPTAMAWGSAYQAGSNDYGTLGGLGLTLEPIAAPFGANASLDRIRLAARALVAGLADAL